MRCALFCHSLLSDWNHGNAHFLRGVASELVSRGHRVDVYEPRDAWSLQHLLSEHGEAPLAAFRETYPLLDSHRYDPARLDLDQALDGVDLVLVHEWNDPHLVERLGRHRRQSRSYRLLFHDTHHRAVTRPEEMSAYDLSGYDGVLAFGAVLRDLYLEREWAERAWTWHEAADVRVFRPADGNGTDGPGRPAAGDLVWIGNWGDEERSRELAEHLLEPVAELGLSARVHGVRYPRRALAALEEAGVAYGGWLPNVEVPETFARFRVTVHVPRRPYAEALPGIPTIRPFEAMACGIPLVSAPWDDCERLFTAGTDYLVARDGRQMRRLLGELLADDERAAELARHGRQTILDRHTCCHRVDELLAIHRELGSGRSA